MKRIIILDMTETPIVNVISPRICMSSIEYKDHALIGHSLRLIKVTDLEKCVMECLNHSTNCNSFNFQYESDSTLSDCQLNTEGKSQVEAFKFIYEKGFIYYEIYG